MDRLLVNFHRSDTQFSSLPPHLRYRPYTVAAPCPNVLPRYLNPRSRSPAPEQLSFKPQTSFSPTAPKHGNVSPRYLQPRARTPEPYVSPKYTKLEEYQTHLRVAAAAGFGNAQPRLLEWREKQLHDNHLSPRQLIAQEREANKRTSSWRSIATNAPSRTFDEIRQRNQQLADAFEAVLKAKAARNKTPSRIEDYRRHGTPIKHHTMSESYVTQRFRNFEPKWVSCGGAGGGRWVRPSDKTPTTKVRASENRVMAYRASSSGRRVSPTHVPRVARLAPSYSLEQIEVDEAASSPRPPSPPYSRSATLASGAGAPSPAPRQPNAASRNVTKDNAPRTSSPDNVTESSTVS